MASVSVNVHVKESTQFTARRVPSSGYQDFATVRIDDAVNIMIFTPEQAKALFEAAREAYAILKTIQFEQANKEFELSES